MNVYLDSSVVLRRLRRESAPLAGWATWEHAYASVLLRVETFRTIDRMRLSGVVADYQVAELISNAEAIFDVVEFVALHPAILNRAAQPFRTAMGTLDALHLATALWLAESGPINLVFLTHDSALAVGARSANFQVQGI
ncbi:MAG: PIN domain-containing protein [Chthoniobacterales bacterium]|nr:PIN domain-containing protein [Chthoniobacterales bacterium]